MSLHVCMKIYILVIVLVLSTLTVVSLQTKAETIPITPVVQTVPIPVVIPAVHIETVNEKIDRYATLYGVTKLMRGIVLCENRSLDPTKQSDIRYNFSDPRRGIVKGERERSYGLAQIHLPDHPNISYIQATNPDFALNFLASNLAAGRGKMWSCYPK